MIKNYRELGVPINEVAIVGGGPAGIGPLIAETRLLRGSVALINPDIRLGVGELEKFQIKSNSGASDFLEGVEHNPLLQGVLQRKSSKRVAAFGNAPLPLQKVGAFLADVGQVVGRSVETSKDGKVVTGRVEKILYYRGWRNTPPLFVTVDDKNKPVTYSRHLVLATGGTEKLDPALSKHRDKVIFSHDIVTHTSIRQIEEVIAANGTIAIVGGAHSAYSAADVLLKRFGNRLHEGSITIFQKQFPKLFFDLTTECIPDWYTLSEGDICKKTARVHRFGGLRGDARKLAIQLATGEEPRVTVETINAQFHERLLASQAIIQATGYTTNEIPIYENRGNEQTRMHLSKDTRRKQIRVDAYARITDISGHPIPGLYGIGLGYGLRPTEEIGGEPNYSGPLDGVNMYHGIAGKRIAEQIFR